MIGNKLTFNKLSGIVVASIQIDYGTMWLYWRKNRTFAYDRRYADFRNISGTVPNV